MRRSVSRGVLGRAFSTGATATRAGGVDIDHLLRGVEACGTDGLNIVAFSGVNLS